MKRGKSFPLPRKVLLGAVMHGFSGPLERRLEEACRLIDKVAREAGLRFPAKRLDLVVLPEHAIQGGDARSAGERALPLDGVVLETFGAKARQHGTYLVLPMILREGLGDAQFSNVAVLLDRTGRVLGMYRKVFPVLGSDGTLEGGITPGEDFPVFDCDFGRVGIQICWDMSYEEGWLELGRRGAEILAVPSASPQTIRPASYALRGGYHVLTSTYHDNATLFSPIGTVLAQTTSAPFLLHEVDLSYAILHWSEKLESGRCLTREFGERVGMDYSEREDTGIFWSNDPTLPIGAMIGELGLIEMKEHIARSRVAGLAARRGIASAPKSRNRKP